MPAVSNISHARAVGDLSQDDLFFASSYFFAPPSWNFFVVPTVLTVPVAEVICIAAAPATSTEVQCPATPPNKLMREIEPKPARKVYLVPAKPHAFGEMGRHLSRVSRKVDWPIGDDID